MEKYMVQWCIPNPYFGHRANPVPHCTKSAEFATQAEAVAAINAPFEGRVFYARLVGFDGKNWPQLASRDRHQKLKINKLNRALWQ